MTHTEKTIKDAVEGGFGSVSESSYGPHHYADLFLNRSFWEAVGKTRGWFFGEECDEFNRCVNADEYKVKWHQFIDHRTEGDDYETALSKLN